MKLIQKLKQKRKDIATREGKELFMILSNATIDEMAKSLPKNKQELLVVKGWGEKKLEKYGDEFLKVLQDEKNFSEQESNSLEIFAASLTEHQPSLFQTRRISLKNPLKEKTAKPLEEKKILEPTSLSEKGIVSVSEFLGNINITLATLGLVKIKGEIADVSMRPSYAFFEIKDSLGGFQSEASLGCFVGWRAFEEVRHLLQNGMEVIISGYPKIYLKNGSFRLEVTNIEPVGEGALQKAFEALKLKLEQKGYFDLERKRPIPPFIRKIGLITSMSGAAVIDFQKNLGSYGLQIQYVDVRVEGDSAEQSIGDAIRTFNEQKESVDVLVLIRGGGSLQSLNAFNSEKIADAIYYSRIPVITGIGHEKDETIAGFVADLNCSTPTAVANFLYNQFIFFKNSLEGLVRSLVRSLDGKFIQKEQKISHQAHYLSSRAQKQFDSKKNQADLLQSKLAFGLQKIFFEFQSLEKIFFQYGLNIERKIFEKKYQIQNQKQKILLASTKKLKNLEEEISFFSEKIKYLNPEAILERGYSIAYDREGKVIKKFGQLQIGQEISLQISDALVNTEIKKISPK